MKHDNLQPHKPGRQENNNCTIGPGQVNCREPSVQYSANGGPGYILSVGLLKLVPLKTMVTCLRQGMPKFKINAHDSSAASGLKLSDVLEKAGP